MSRSLLTVLICLLVIGCAGGRPDENATVESVDVAVDIDGMWVGKTSQDRTIAFVVKDGSVSSLKLGVSLKLDAVCARPGSSVATDYRGGESEVVFAKPMPVSSRRFMVSAGVSDVDAQVLGTFAQDVAKGTINLEATPSSGCSGKDRLTWSVTRAPASK